MNKNGFTLLEMLFSLSITAVIILIIPPFNHNIIENLKKEQFFTLFQSDVLYIQQMQSTTDKNYRIRFFNEYYAIYYEDKSIIKRDFPKDWIVDTRGNNIIVFKRFGTILSPRTIVFKTKSDIYHAIFPLGKGRFYIEKK